MILVFESIRNDRTNYKNEKPCVSGSPSYEREQQRDEKKIQNVRSSVFIITQAHTRTYDGNRWMIFCRTKISGMYIAFEADYRLIEVITTSIF